MKPAELDAHDLPNVILFAPGKPPFNKEPYEPLIADRAIARIVAAYIDPGMEDLALTQYYADETSAAEIVGEAQTLPFLAPKRVIIVRNCDRYNLMSGEKGSPLAPLLAYLESPSEATVLVLVAPQVDKRKKFYKACHKAGAVVECPQLDDRELAAWVRDEAATLGKKIGGSAIGELLSRAGARLSDVKNSLALVANFVGENETIRDQDVIQACADVAEETVWNLTDAIAASNTRKAVATLHELMGLGKAPDEIIGIINWLLESAYKAAPDTAPKMQSAFVAKKVMPLVDKWGLAKLKAALALCTDTHFSIRSTGVDTKLALELLVIKLAAPVARRRTAAAR